jgi:hypothetical protein
LIAHAVQEILPSMMKADASLSEKTGAGRGPERVMGGKPRTQIFSPVSPRWPTFDKHPVCGIGYAPLQQSGGDDRKVFTVERADRHNQTATKRAAEN